MEGVLDFFLLFFILTGDRNLTNGLWQQHGQKLKGRETTTTCVATGMAVAEVYVAVAEVCGGAVVQACCGGVTKVI
jgi:hypothetical protein